MRTTGIAIHCQIYSFIYHQHCEHHSNYTCTLLETDDQCHFGGRERRREGGRERERSHLMSSRKSISAWCLMCSLASLSFRFVLIEALELPVNVRSYIDQNSTRYYNYGHS